MCRYEALRAFVQEDHFAFSGERFTKRPNKQTNNPPGGCDVRIRLRYLLPLGLNT